MNLIQLPVPLPARIVGGKVSNQEWSGPTGDGMIVGWFKPHIEHNIVYIVILNETGQFWEVESPFIRATTNKTWGRNAPEGSPCRNESRNAR